MVFVADDLSAWLVSLLADAGRKKLTALVLGNEQQRALGQAATSAVLATVAELDPSDGDRVNELAMVINEVFQAPDLGPLTPAATVLESLQEGVAARLAVLGDASLTGTGLSSAEVLGVDMQALAGLLAGELVREIIRRGARGSVLAPLADQLNHDRTHLQRKRLEGMLAYLVQAVSDTVARIDGRTATWSSLLADWKDLPGELDARLVHKEASGLNTAGSGGSGAEGSATAAPRDVSPASEFALPSIRNSPSLIKAWSDSQADVRLLKAAALLDEASAAVNSQTPGLRVSTDARPIAPSAGPVQQAIACAVRALDEGVSLPSSLLAASKSVVDRIVEADPDLVHLRYDLARLRGRMNDYAGALVEINEMVKGPDPPTAQYLSFAGEMLMNAGSISYADRAFEIASRTLREPGVRSPAVVGLLSEEDRIREWIRCEQFRKIWLPDYRGHTTEGLRAAKLLLPQARELGGDILETVLHRVARAQCDLGVQRRDVSMIEAGIHTNQIARAAVPDADLPLSYLLDYSAMSSMRLPGTKRSWDIAKEHIEGYPDAVRAHLLFASGKRLRAETPIAAINDLENVLEIWVGHPYSVGVCEALIELGLAYSQLGTRAMQRRALEYFGAARLICERFAFAMDKNIQRYINLCASHLGIPEQQACSLAEERLSLWPQLRGVHDLSCSGFHALRSFVEADVQATSSNSAQEYRSGQ